jgi:hypothetical protein
MDDLESNKGKPQQDFSTWLGLPVKSSEHYPDMVFVAGSEHGVVAMEAVCNGCYWAAKIRVDRFEGKAMSSNRARSRAEAERRLLENMSKDPEGLRFLLALNLFALLNPALITGDPTCLNLN